VPPGQPAPARFGAIVPTSSWLGAGTEEPHERLTSKGYDEAERDDFGQYGRYRVPVETGSNG